MRIFVAKEDVGELRVAAVPETVRRLVALGLEVLVAPGLGKPSRIPDAQYKEVGASLDETGEAEAEADIVLRVQPPSVEQISGLKRGCLHMSFLNPFADDGRLKALADAGVSAVSLEMMPRTTLAQKMDALSSQASLAGYAAVLMASSKLPDILPMMMTPAGTLQPARFFIIGVGVAGLQAIATAKRMGARVEAFDTRPVVEEQVKSLGARFVKIDLGEMGQTKDGYAKELTPEQLELQRQGMAKACAQADVVITTAKLFGRPAPRILTKEMVDGMKSGSVIVDLAAETGGNVEGTVVDKEVVTDGGVLILGPCAAENMVSRSSSRMYASNLTSFLEHFWDKEKKTLPLDREDEIIRGCLLTHDGAIVHERFAS